MEMLRKYVKERGKTIIINITLTEGERPEICMGKLLFFGALPP
jgi:hypothetical protein